MDSLYKLSTVNKSYLAIFLLIIFGNLSQWVCQAIGTVYLIYAFQIIVFTLFLRFCFLRLLIPKKIIHIFGLIFFVYSIVGIVNMLAGRPFTGSSGIYGLLLEIFVFTAICFNSAKQLNVCVLYRIIGLIYTVSALYIGLEIIILIFEPSVLSNNIKNYRLLPGQPIYEIFGLESLNGYAPNSHIVFPQAASQFLALSIIWFAPVFNNNLIEREGCQIHWQLWFSLTLFFMSVTTTGLIMLALLFMLQFSLWPRHSYNPFFIRARFLILILFVLVIAFGGFELIFFKFTESSEVDYYLNAFLDAPIKYLDLPIFYQLFGMHADLNLLSHGEMGWAMLFWNSGALCSTAFIIFFYCVISISIRMAFKGIYMSVAEQRRSIFLILVVIQIIGWLISLIHYRVLLQYGAREIFAALIAFSLYVSSKISYDYSVANENNVVGIK